MLVGFLLGAFKGDLQSLLNGFLTHLTGNEGQLASRSALSQARYKLKASAFVDLNQRLLAWLAEHLPEPRWHGFRLVAADGTTLHLPPSVEVMRDFGSLEDEYGNLQVMGRAVGLFSVTGKRMLQAVLDAYDCDERSLLMRCLDVLGTGDLLLLDRGYPARWLFAELIRRGIAFCIRADSSKLAEVQAFLRSGLNEKIVTLRLAPQDQKRAASHGVRLNGPSITVRLVRVVLPSGRIEVLVTSLLDSATYPADLFGPLYHQRWLIEECFKTLKARLHIEQFTGFLPEAVEQDFQARMVQLNLVASLCQSVEENLPEHKQGRYRAIFSFALKTFRWKLGEWLVQGLNLDSLATLMQTLAKNLNFLRPPRFAPRNIGHHSGKSRMVYR